MINFKLLFLDLLYFTEVKNKIYQFIILVQPLVFLLFYKFILELGGNASYSIIYSIGIMSAWSFILYSSGVALVGERWNMSLEPLIITKTSLFSLLLIKSINVSIVGILSVIITFIYANFVFGRDLLRVDTTIILNISLLFITLISISIFISVAFSFITKNTYAIQNLLQLPILILSGLFYPTENLPLLFYYISQLLPLTPLLEFERTSNAYNLIHLLVLNAVYITISFVVLKGYFDKLKETLLKGVF